ncbi:MAG: hypothetical protein KIT00_13185 [Rhodospirillales bacterium]|nr:hypothetical protein [Rhodospirillales bacterium]
MVLDLGRSHGNSATDPDGVEDIHRQIGDLLVEIDRWEQSHGPYDRRQDDVRFDIRLKTLLDHLCRATAKNETEVMRKLERAVHVGGRGTPIGDRLIEGALRDLRQIRVMAFD